MLLLLAVTATSLGIVYARHESRRLFADLHLLTQKRDEMNVEWGQLLLEQSTWGAHGRVEQLAREQLQMRIPMPKERIIVKP
jgi:cell division protein FtsL